MSGSPFNWKSAPSVLSGDKAFARKAPTTAAEILRVNQRSNIACSNQADRDKTAKIIGRRNEARSQ